MTWWETDTYDDDTPIPEEIREAAGPKGVAIVQVWPDGKTNAGWGRGKHERSDFIQNYERQWFSEKRVMAGYPKSWAFAFVMRSVRMVCIDIDGKNGGLQNIGKLGMLPYTMAETSKSGNGYHLFYWVADDVWDPNLGYKEFGDRINIEQGVDFRGVGCVYHYPSQRWNDRIAVELPDHLKDRLKRKEAATAAQVDAIVKLLEAGEEEEVLLMQNQLIEDLNKPIQDGRRNTTLFAIGTQMKLAAVPGWEKLVFDRAIQVGLDAHEAGKVVGNILRYGGA